MKEKILNNLKKIAQYCKQTKCLECLLRDKDYDDCCFSNPVNLFKFCNSEKNEIIEDIRKSLLTEIGFTCVSQYSCENCYFNIGKGKTVKCFLSRRDPCDFENDLDLLKSKELKSEYKDYSLEELLLSTELYKDYDSADYSRYHEWNEW